MARPLKKGIDYFPLNVDMDEEDEHVYMLEAKFGVEGFGVLIKLLMWIYRNGYYYSWGEKEQLFFARKKAVDITLCRQVCDFCIQSGFFCKHLYEKYGILTSRGIQKRYLEATQKRKKILFIKEFLLLDPASEINSDINLVYTGFINVAHNSVELQNSRINVAHNSVDNPISKNKSYPFPRSSRINVAHNSVELQNSRINSAHNTQSKVNIPPPREEDGKPSEEPPPPALASPSPTAEDDKSSLMPYKTKEPTTKQKENPLSADVKPSLI